MSGSGRLLNILGLGFGLAGAVGGTIGAGILRTPGLVAAQLPSAPLVLVAWLVVRSRFVNSLVTWSRKGSFADISSRSAVTPSSSP